MQRQQLPHTEPTTEAETDNLSFPEQTIMIYNTPLGGERAFFLDAEHRARLDSLTPTQLSKYELVNMPVVKEKFEPSKKLVSTELRGEALIEAIKAKKVTTREKASSYKRKGKIPHINSIKNLIPFNAVPSDMITRTTTLPSGKQVTRRFIEFSSEKLLPDNTKIIGTIVIGKIPYNIVSIKDNLKERLYLLRNKNLHKIKLTEIGSFELIEIDENGKVVSTTLREQELIKGIEKGTVCTRMLVHKMVVHKQDRNPNEVNNTSIVVHRLDRNLNEVNKMIIPVYDTSGLDTAKGKIQNAVLGGEEEGESILASNRLGTVSPYVPFTESPIHDNTYIPVTSPLPFKTNKPSVTHSDVWELNTAIPANGNILDAVVVDKEERERILGESIGESFEHTSKKLRTGLQNVSLFTESPYPLPFNQNNLSVTKPVNYFRFAPPAAFINWNDITYIEHTGYGITSLQLKGIWAVTRVKEAIDIKFKEFNYHTTLQVDIVENNCLIRFKPNTPPEIRSRSIAEMLKEIGITIQREGNDEGLNKSKENNL